MQFIINKDKLTDIENAFKQLKSNEKETHSLSLIAEALKSITRKGFRVTTIEPTRTHQPCVGMSIYPEESAIEKIIDAIVEEKDSSVIEALWKDTGIWIIEIDTTLLRPQTDLSERELTALLLHEVGHIIGSNIVVSRITNIIETEYVKMQLVSKQVIRSNFFNKILALPIIAACEFNTKGSSLRKEITADSYVIKCGYGKELETAIDKIVLYIGNELSPEEATDEVMSFAVTSIEQLQKRQNAIVRKNIATMLRNTPGRLAKQVLSRIEKSLSGSNGKTSVTQEAKDEYINKKIDYITEHAYDFMEESFFNKVHKMKKIDPADIDYIAIELDSIRSNDDKMMIVSYIYNKLDTINYYIELIDSKNAKYSIPHSRESLIKMRDRLEYYKRMAIMKKIPTIEYNINLTYPKGYEG